ncbi:MAG: sterol desaturase family protein [Nannocystaceae bacterium]|nr:sterol desaturase family protein [bacterium]
MEQLERIASGVLGQLNTPTVSVYWLYLLTAALLASALYLHGTRREATVRGWLGFLFPRAVLRHRSVRNDLALFVLNTMLHSFVFVVPLQTVSAGVASGVWRGMHALWGPLPTPLAGPGLWVGVTVGLFVVADLAFFVSHLLLHRIAWLWELHKVHHSAPVLTPLSVFRRHPGDILFDGLVGGVMMGVAYGLIGWSAGEVVTGQQILGVNALLFTALILGFNLQHSHVWLTWGPLERLLISPAAHQIHHSNAPEHHDRNFGNMLSVWDRLLRTYVSPTRTPQRLEFGLGTETDRYRSVWRLYVVPLVRIFVRNGARGGGTTRS